MEVGVEGSVGIWWSSRGCASGNGNGGVKKI